MKTPMDNLLDATLKRALKPEEHQALVGYIAQLRRESKGTPAPATSSDKHWRIAQLERDLRNCREVLRKYDLNKHMD